VSGNEHAFYLQDVRVQSGQNVQSGEIGQLQVQDSHIEGLAGCGSQRLTAVLHHRHRISGLFERKGPDLRQPDIVIRQ
jgi:hypothetical protein